MSKKVRDCDSCCMYEYYWTIQGGEPTEISYKKCDGMSKKKIKKVFRKGCYILALKNKEHRRHWDKIYKTMAILNKRMLKHGERVCDGQLAMLVNIMGVL